MKLGIALITVGACVSAALAQYDGPFPPRPAIPGAVPVNGARPVARRRPIARILDEQPQRRPQVQQQNRGAPRRLPSPLLDQSLQTRPAPSSREYDEAPVRRLSLRPGPRRLSAAPEQSPQNRQRPVYQEAPIPLVRAPVLSQPQHLNARPVVEDEEDDEEGQLSTYALPSTTSPPVAQPQLPTLPPPQPSPQLFNNLDDFPVPTRQQFRPQPPPQQEEEQQYIRQPRPQPTPIVRQQPQEIVRQEQPRPKPYAQQQYNRQQQVARPAQKEIVHSKDEESSNRQRKPTSQVLRKYREDNADGSITWGYENDDGSFKEETIGTDCVTTGKYGYVDPDGVRREFSYSSGIPCDKTQDSETQASEGYIDYSNNQYVFPNGQTIDLNSMVRNRARKPTYRN